jgi:hypothetical protein
MITHIEEVVKEATVVKRGPNFFLKLDTQSNHAIYVNEWSQEGTSDKAKSFATTNELRTHFGTFSQSDVSNMKQKIVVCDSRAKTDEEFFFTTNLSFKEQEVKEVKATKKSKAKKSKAKKK